MPSNQGAGYQSKIHKVVCLPKKGTKKSNKIQYKKAQQNTIYKSPTKCDIQKVNKRQKAKKVQYSKDIRLRVCQRKTTKKSNKIQYTDNRITQGIFNACYRSMVEFPNLTLTLDNFGRCLDSLAFSPKRM